MELSSLATSMGTPLVIFVVLVLVFTWLSRKPGNEVVYYPGRILRRLDPWEDPTRTRSPFAWIREAFEASEADVVAAGGVDAAAYLVFLISVLGILVLSGIILLPAHLLVATTDHSVKTSHATTDGTLSNLVTGNAEDESPRLWIFLLATYWVSIVTFYVLWKACDHVCELRASARGSAEAKPEDFTLIVREIFSASQNQSLKVEVDSFFRSLNPKTYYKSMMVTDTKEANRIWVSLNSYKKELSHAEVVFAKSKSTGKPEGIRPTTKTGFHGLIGKKVYTIDYCNEKIKELLSKLEAEQKNPLREKLKNAALIFFNSRHATVYASQATRARMTRWRVMEAPNPCQLIWENLPKTVVEGAIRESIVDVVVFMGLVFYMLPILTFSAPTNLQNLSRLLPVLKTIVDQPEIKRALEGFLPQLALIMFMALLPKFLMILSKAEGILSQSQAIQAASRKYSYFMLFNVFLGITLGGTLFSSIQIILSNPEKIVSLFGEKLPEIATFFRAYVSVKFFVGYGLELSRLVPLIMFHLKKKYLCKTEVDLKEAWAPGDLGLANRVPNDMLVVLIVLCYSVIDPLIIPIGVAYFGFGLLITRNQVLKVYATSCESYGRMWPHMHALILAVLMIYQVTMSSYIGLKNFRYVPFLLPLPVISLNYASECKRVFYPAFCDTPLEETCCELKETPNLESIYKAYIPPCLKPEMLEDVDQFEDAQS